MIKITVSDITLRTKKESEKTYVYDIIRKKWILLTQEEYVRQCWVHYLIQIGYPASMIAVEKTIAVGSRKKRFDIVVYDKQHQPWMLIECKEPNVPVDQGTLFQLLHYQRILQSRYWVLTNGPQSFCVNANDLTAVQWLDELPAYEF